MSSAVRVLLRTRAVSYSKSRRIDRCAVSTRGYESDRPSHLPLLVLARTGPLNRCVCSWTSSLPRSSKSHLNSESASFSVDS